MESKFTIFVVFAVLAQSSLAVSPTAFENSLTDIINAEENFTEVFNKLVDTFFDAAALYTKKISGSQDDASIATEIDTLMHEGIAYYKKAYDYTRDGLAPIAQDTSALIIGESEVYASAETSVRRVFSVFNETTQAGIEAIKKTSVEETGIIWNGIYDMFRNAMSTDELSINNLIETLRPKAVVAGQTGFGAVFSALKASESDSCLDAIEAERGLSRASIIDEVRYKNAAFQYLATAFYLTDNQMIIESNKLHVLAAGMVQGLSDASEALFTVLLAIAENKDTPIDTLREKLSAGFYASNSNARMAVLFTQPGPHTVVTYDVVEGNKKLDIMAETLSEAVDMIQNTNTSEALAEIETLKESGVAAAVDVFRLIYEQIISIGSTIDDDLVAKAESAWEIASVQVSTGFTELFSAIKAVVSKDTSVSETGCSEIVTAIKTAQTVASTEFTMEMSKKLQLIQAFRLYAILKANDISVDLSLLIVD